MPSLNDEQLPHVTSGVGRFLVNPDGDANGMILLNGVEVHFAPCLSTAVLTAIHVGDRITVYGVLPMAEPMIVAVVIEATNGARIEDYAVADLIDRGGVGRLRSLVHSGHAKGSP